MKKQTHPNLWWTEDEHIYSFGKTIALMEVCFVRSATLWLKVTY